MKGLKYFTYFMLISAVLYLLWLLLYFGYELLGGSYMEVLLLFAFILYFLPFIVAANRNRQPGAIFILNLLLGWTLVGWVVALVWACTSEQEHTTTIVQESKKASSADELEKLANLKERGILTEEEFEQKKKEILGL